MRDLPTILLSLCLTLCCTACRTVPSGERTESFIQTEDGVLLHYTMIQGGPETLIVPGESWLHPDLDRLAVGRTVIYYDLRGRGRSQKLDMENRPTLERDLRDLEEIRRWFKLERFSLLGRSYEATVAGLYAARLPQHVESLVLVAPAPVRRVPYWKIFERVFKDRLDDAPFLELMRMRQELVNRRDPEQYAAAYREAVLTGLVRDPSSLSRMKAPVLVEPNIDPERIILQYLRVMHECGEWDWRGELAAVRAPTLVIYGNEDPMPRESHSEWIASIPSARGEAVDRCANLPWLERPSAFFDAVEGFLPRSGR